MATNDLNDDEPIDVEPAELKPLHIVNLNEWLVPVATAEPTQVECSATTSATHIEQAEATFQLPAFYFARPAANIRDTEEVQLALDFG